ncbi:MAG: hypothetical protein ACOX4Z_11325 [Desulfobulbus sp.]|jgi:hypothetical protein
MLYKLAQHRNLVDAGAPVPKVLATMVKGQNVHSTGAYSYVCGEQFLIKNTVGAC